MCKCLCNCLNNLMARIVYTVLIGGVCTISLLLCFDTWYLSMPFYKRNFADDKGPMMVLSVTTARDAETPIFHFKYPGQVQLLTTTAGTCVAYIQDKGTPFSIGNIIQARHTHDSEPISWHFEEDGYDSFVCQEDGSYEYTSTHWFFNNLNQCIFWSVIAVCIVIAFMLLGVWLCCFGWCGCRCCAICQLCASNDAKSQSQTVEVRYV